jgi:hypothetical protein
MTDMHPYAAHDLGDVFAGIHDETDEDHTGRERVTPAGSLWYVADVNRYEYPAYSGPNGSHPAGSVCAYTMVCPATGAAITPYAPTTDGAPFAHFRDEMAHFVKVDLPGEAWPTLRRQLEALRDVKDEVHELEDRHADEDTTPEDYEVFYGSVANLLRVARLTTPNTERPDASA